MLLCSTNEEQKKVGLWCTWYLHHTALTLTAGHKMAALMVAFSGLDKQLKLVVKSQRTVYCVYFWFCSYQYGQWCFFSSVPPLIQNIWAREDHFVPPPPPSSFSFTTLKFYLCVLLKPVSFTVERICSERRKLYKENCTDKHCTSVAAPVGDMVDQVMIMVWWLLSRVLNQRIGILTLHVIIYHLGFFFV